MILKPPLRLRLIVADKSIIMAQERFQSAL